MDKSRTFYESRGEIFIEEMFAFLHMNYQLLSSDVFINKVCVFFFNLNKIKSLKRIIAEAHELCN